MTQGYFSVLRWRTDTTRDEARNVAVILVEAEGQFGGMRSAPISSISPNLHEQGLLDAMVVGLERRFEAQQELPTLGDLREMYRSLEHSLYVTEPKQVIVPDVDSALNALYRAYVAPRGGGSRTLTKGRVLDRVVTMLRRTGHAVRRGEYVRDFLFDIVIDAPDPLVAEVLSFATTTRQWMPVEHDAGHFLFALEKVHVPGIAILQPPSDASYHTAQEAFERVQRWCDASDVRTIAPDDLAASGRLPI